LGLALIVCVVFVLILPWRRHKAPSLPAHSDVVLVTVASLRSDLLASYGAPPGTTPNLDALAREAVLFEDAVTPTPLTAAGLASIMTARLPIQHRLRGDLRGHLPARETTLAELLQERGYSTAAFLSARLPATGLEQGFDTLAVPAGPQRVSRAVVREALEYLAGMDTAPLFLWVHIHEPHGPWKAPFPWSLRLLDAPYQAEVAAADEALGELVEGLRAQERLESTHLVVLSPTGEGLGDEGEVEHGLLLGESTLRVPWIWRLPRGSFGRAEAGRRVPGLTATTDLGPTLLGLLGEEPWPARTAPEGVSLADNLMSGERTTRERVLIETLLPQRSFGWAPLLGLRTPEWKLVAGPAPRLFALGDHPRRQRQPGPATQQMTDSLLEALETEIARRSPESSEAQAWREGMEGRPDPYLMAPFGAALIKASRALQSGEAERAAEVATSLVSRFPESPRIHLLDAFVKLGLGKLQGAERGFRGVLEAFAAACEARMGLGECLLEQGRAEAALSALGPVAPDSLGDCLPLLSPDPELSARLWRAWGLAHARTGGLAAAADAFARTQRVAVSSQRIHDAAQLSQAARFLRDVKARAGDLHASERPLVVRSALQLGAPEIARELLGLGTGRPGGSRPNDPHLALLEAREAVNAGRLERARTLIHRALERGIVEPEDCLALAAAFERRHLLDDAISLLERALPVFPESSELHFQLALRQARRGKSEPALIHLETALRLGFRGWDRLLQSPLRQLCSSDRIARFWRGAEIS
jgi:arylsulfatase A-like enzyme/tetratricopeptide (TPR) repeat protein